MTFFKTWLLGVVAAALAVALAQALTPEGAVKRVLRLMGGMVLLLAVARPLLRLAPSELAMAVDLPAAQTAAEAGGEVIKELIAERTGAYIVDKGSALGVVCAARVETAPDESGWPVPWSVTVSGTWTGEQRKRLSQAIAQELDIPEERQSFQEAGT